MKVMISPARRFKPSTTVKAASAPRYIEKSGMLLKALKSKNPFELQEILGCNEKLTQEAFLYYQEMDLLSVDLGRISQKPFAPAVLSYDGLVFRGMQPEGFSHDDLAFANENLRILSAFYGVLRPLAGILPYRLELLSKLRMEGENLYSFWDRDYYNALFEDNEPLINLASEEYAKTIRKFLLPENRFIDIVFLSFTKGKLRVTVTQTKTARGNMAGFIIRNKIALPQDLKQFRENDFKFEESLSFHNRFVFIR